MSTVVEEAVQVLGPDNAGELISAEQFASADFVKPFKYERVKGRLVVLPPTSTIHRRTSRPIRLELSCYWGAHRDYVDDVDVAGWLATSDDDDRLPDICVYLNGPNSHLQPPERVPELVFEIVSGSRSDQERDYIDKRSEYHAVGVKEYVIVDRFKTSVLVLTWAKQDYEERELAAADVYTTSLLPGLRVPLADVFVDD